MSSYPKKLFSKLVEVNITYGFKLGEDRQMVEVIANAPKMYTTTLAIETRLCEAVAIPLTLDGLQSTMTSFLRIEHEDYDNESGSDTDEEGEIVTTVVDKEQRIYFKCGKTGYIARKCRSGSGSGVDMVAVVLKINVTTVVSKAIKG